MGPRKGLDWICVNKRAVGCAKALQVCLDHGGDDVNSGVRAASPVDVLRELPVSAAQVDDGANPVVCQKVLEKKHAGPGHLKA